MIEMKKLFYSVLITVLWTGLITSAIASETDLQKTYSWKYNINKDGNVTVDNYDCNLSIHAWDKAETEFHLTIDAKTQSDADAEILDSYLSDMKFSNSNTAVKFGNTFWENRNNIKGRITMKLASGKTVSLSEFSMKGELWVPPGSHLILSSKYSEVKLEDFGGLLELDLYNDNLYAGNVNGKASIVDKYSTLEFKDMKDVEADLYNSKVQAKNTGNLKIVSKYCKFSAETTGNLNIDSYNDNFSFLKTGTITFLAKYSDLKSDISGRTDLDCYEGTIILKQTEEVKIASKYADFQIENAVSINISSSYNDKFTTTKLNTLSIAESKYCDFKIGELKTSLTESDGYEDKFHVQKTGQDFKELNVNGKYTEITFGLPKTLDYKFKAKIQYARLEMNEPALTAKTKIVDGSNLEYDAVKGTEKEGMPRIEVNGYEMSLKIIEL